MSDIKLKKWAKDLFPLNRSLTGKGVIQTLEYIKKNINNDIKIRHVKSGTKVFDWKIPKTWEIHSATLSYEDGKKICDFKENNLHVVGYSTNINKLVKFNELKNHLFYMKDKPNAIPYVTSYYKKNWGFCIKYDVFKKIDKSKKFRVEINSRLKNDKLTYGEYTLLGKSKKEIIITSYICHPSLANNELSGILALSILLKKIKKSFYTIKIILIPETIGALWYIKKNFKNLKNNLVAGFNITCVGIKGPISYIATKNENTYADTIMQSFSSKYKIKKYSFLKRGSNERQFGCQNLKLPYITIFTKRFGEYKEYHTSLDNLKILNYKQIQSTCDFLIHLLRKINNSNIFIKNTIGEPFLNKRNLIDSTSTLDNMLKSNRYNLSNIIAYVEKNEDTNSLSQKLKIKKNDLDKYIKILEKEKIITKFS